MNNNKIWIISILLILLILMLTMIAVGVVMIVRRGHGGTTPGRDSGTVTGDLDPAGYAAVVNDRLRIGDGDSERDHGLTLSGAVKKDTLTAATGTRRDTYEVLSFSGKGAAAEWTMAFSDGGKADCVMLEIEEIHRDNLEVLAYTVYVDGRETYFRTYEQISSSPNHYFIAVDRADMADPSAVKVKIVSETDCVFSVSEVTGYTDFYEKLAAAGLDGTMRLYLHSSDSAELARQHLADFASADYSHFDLGLMFKLNYMTVSDEQAVEQISSFIAAAAKSGLPLQLMPTLSWAAPYDVADGLGGSFTDVRYGQVLYNSLTGEWVDSTPNAYGDTQWCSWGEPTLLTAQRERILSVFDRVTKYLYAAAADGRLKQPVSTLLEHSVVYKGPLPQSSIYTMGLIDGGDFNPVVIAAAKNDGIVLDPTDGLSYEEKKWMNEYQARYVQSLADIYQKAYGSDPIVIRNGEVLYPTGQRTNEIYSHTVQWIDQTPSHGDLRISGWKSGIGTGFYEACEEFALIDDIRFYQYRVAYGKTGNCNFEMASLNDPKVFRASIAKLYEAGVNFVTLFNDKSEYRTASMLAEIDRTLPGEEASAPVHYDESLLWVDYNRDAADRDLLTASHGVVSQKNLRVDPSDGALLPAVSSGERYITYRVTDREAWTDGIFLELEAYQIGSGRIRVYAGETEESLTEIGVFRYDRAQVTSFNRYSVELFDLKTASKGRSEYFIRLVFEGTGPSQTQVKSVTIRKAFEKTTGQKNGLTFTKEQVRLMNLWVSARAEAERMREAYVEKNGGENAVSRALGTLKDMGCPIEATRLASREISKLFPIGFAILGGGRLDDLPVNVKTASETTAAQLVLESLTDTGAAFTVGTTYQFNERSRKLTVTFTGLKSGRYRLDQPAWNRYILIKDSDGAYQTGKDGFLTLEITAAFEEKPVYTTLQGRVISCSNGTIQLTVQDPAISGYRRQITVMTGSKAAFTRRQAGSDEIMNGQPKAGDYAVLTFSEDGVTLLTCEAFYGVQAGVIRSFTPPDPSDANTTNGLIAFEDGSVFELEYQAYTTVIRFRGEEAYYVRSMTVDEMKETFRPGRRVTVTYCPEYYGTHQRLLSISD